MQKTYYNDPLAAAWMEKHFGMDFSDTSDGDGTITINNYFNDGIPDYLVKLYIHPDSLHLLEPQEKDLIEFKNIGKNSYYPPQDRDDPLTKSSFCILRNTKIDWAGGEFYHVYRAGMIYVREWEIMKIIQRNGIAFMWPEFEV